MNKADIEEFVRDRVAEYLKVPVASVTPDANLDELGMDSLGALELILTCEEEYGFAIALDKEEVMILTVADAVNYVEGRVRAASDVAESIGAQ